MKIQKISNYFTTVVKNVLKSTNKQKNLTKTIMPYSSIALAAYYLQNENESKMKILNDIAEDKFVLDTQTSNLKHITELENLGVTKPQLPWDAPPFDNGILTDTKYREIVQQIKDSTLLTDSQKQEHLKKLAHDNYKSYEPSFQQAQDSSDYNVYDGNNDDSCCDCDSDDDCCDSDSDCDSDCDSGDALLSSF